MNAGAAIRVSVLEGSYVKMAELGLYPFKMSLTVELHCRSLRLDSLLWTVHLSNGGYSVSLFWPSQQRHPRCRRQRRKAKTSHQPVSSPNPAFNYYNPSGESVSSLHAKKLRLCHSYSINCTPWGVLRSVWQLKTVTMWILPAIVNFKL